MGLYEYFKPLVCWRLHCARLLEMVIRGQCPHGGGVWRQFGSCKIEIIFNVRETAVPSPDIQFLPIVFLFNCGFEMLNVYI